MVQASMSHKSSDYLRHSLLKLLWEECVDYWSEEYDGVESEWVAMIRQSSSKQDDTFHRSYRAFLNIEKAGALQCDINEFARMVGFVTTLKALGIIDQRLEPGAGKSAPRWMLVEADHNDTPTDRHLAALANDLQTVGPC